MTNTPPPNLRMADLIAKTAKVTLKGCSGMCIVLPPGGEAVLVSSVDYTTEEGLKEMSYNRYGVADDCDPAKWTETTGVTPAPRRTVSGASCGRWTKRSGSRASSGHQRRT